MDLSVLLREERRLAALRRYDILGTAPEEAFDRITRLAAKLLEMPISITGFIDETRHWFKAVVGVDMQENTRAGSFCQYTVEQSGVLVVPDAAADERFAELPVVKHGPARFYAGAPLVTSDGYAIGTLCVLDVEPRPGLDEAQMDILSDLAYLLVDELELRSSAKRLQKERDESERLRSELDRFFSLSVDLFCIVTLDGTFTHVNPAWQKTFGYSKEELVGQPFISFVHPDDHERTLATAAKLQDDNGSIEGYEDRYRTKSGEYRWLRWSSQVNRIDERIYAVARDVTERKRAELEVRQLNKDLEERVAKRTHELQRLNERLQYDAFHDSLTGLANRALLLDRLEQTMQRRQQRPAVSYAALFLDLDRFKLVNDSLGHRAGDTLLQELGKRLERCVRPVDTVARLGGDEFVVLLDSVETTEAVTRTAERIQLELAKPFEFEEQSLHTSASIGVVLSCAGHHSAEAVLRDADLAMYRAKALGKARYQIFTQEMRDRALSLMSLENDLRRAAERGELRVFYQPIVTVASEQVTGFEALVRWEHPVHGLVSPAEFIPLAEETGLIVELDRWVLREACAQVKSWQTNLARPELTISVNLSGQQFDDPALAQYVGRVLDETGLDANRLNLEITESTLMQQAEQTVKTLQQLRALGLQIYIDDFGTGYSSLSYLQRFPVNTLKIDRVFVNQMLHGSESAALITTIITMAENLKLTVVAEGIETQEQLQRLRTLGCDLAQGYFFAKPLPKDEVAEYLSAKSLVYLA